jgi:alpha-L-fucosidase
MKTSSLLVSLLIPALLLNGCNPTPVSPNTASEVSKPEAPPTLTPEEARVERLGWWREARFGMFIHWGLYAIPGGTWKDTVRKRGYSEWIMYSEKIPREEYAQLAKKFNPDQFDPDEWAAIAKSAGMKYVVITAKHHDGFSIFDSQVTDYDVMDATPYKRDIIKELEEACHRAGLHFGIYYSVDRDWYRPTGPGGERYKQTNTWDFPDSTDEDFDTYFEEIAVPQVKELITQYDIDLIWFDAIEMKSPDQIETLYNAIRELSPDTIINSRIWSPRFPKEIPPPYCDYISSGDNEILENAIDFDWENPGSMNTSYGYNPNDHNWVETGEIIRRLADIVSKGGNYLLNVGPSAEGLIPQPCIERFAQVGKWMKVNGEAIYGASAWQATHEDEGVYYTSKGKTIYAICTKEPEGEILLSAFRQKNLNIDSVSILGSDQPVTWEESAEGLKLSLPAQAPNPHAVVYRIITK